MSKKRAILAAVSVAALALTTAGCSSGGSSSGSDGGATLTYWASNQGTSIANDKEVLTPVLDKFTKDTGVKVKLEVIGWNDQQTRIQTAVTSRQGPDVLNIGNTWAASLEATGAFLPYDDANMKAIGGADKFVETALKTGGVPDKPVTSVPLYGLAYGLYYNKQMFTDAGLQVPTNWAELVSAAQNGAEFFNAKGDPTFTADGIASGIKRYLDLMQGDKVVNPSNAQYDNATKTVNDFATKKVAMILSQNNADNSIVANGMTSSEYGVVPFPAPADGEAIATFPAGINISIFKKTKNKDAALKFVKYMTSEETQTTLGKPYASLPVLKDAKPVFTDNAEEAKMFQNIYNTMSKPLPLVPAEDQFENTVGKAMNDMFAKIATGGTVSEADIQSALKAAEEQVKASIG